MHPARWSLNAVERRTALLGYWGYVPHIDGCDRESIVHGLYGFVTSGPIQVRGRKCQFLPFSDIYGMVENQVTEGGTPCRA